MRIYKKPLGVKEYLWYVICLEGNDTQPEYALFAKDMIAAYKEAFPVNYGNWELEDSSKT